MAKFKKGDIVKQIDPKEVGSSAHLSTDALGDIYKIDEDGSEIPFAINQTHKRADGIRSVLDENAFELVKEEKEFIVEYVKDKPVGHTFTIGDKVIMQSNCSGCKEGQIYTLEFYGLDQSLIAVDKNDRTVSGCMCQEKWKLCKEFDGNIFYDEPTCIFRQDFSPTPTLTTRGSKFSGTLIKNNKKTFMSILREVSVKLRAALGEVKANQIVAGLRFDNLSLTCEGKDVVLNAIADGENPVDALVAEATRIIDEAKKNK